MSESKPTEVPDKVVPLEPAEPVEMPAAMGATFSERAAARKKAVEAAENKSVASSAKSRK